MGVHHALGIAGGTGREEHGCHIGGDNPGHFFLEEIGVDGGERFAGSLQLIHGRQSGLVVVAQTTRVIEKDVLQLRAAFANLQQLVDLLLVFGKGETHFRIVDGEHALGRHSVLVQRNRNRAQRLHRQHGGIQPGAVGAHHHHMLTAAQTGLVQACGQVLDHGGQIGPGQ